MKYKRQYLVPIVLNIAMAPFLILSYWWPYSLIGVGACGVAAMISGILEDDARIKALKKKIAAEEELRKEEFLRAVRS